MSFTILFDRLHNRKQPVTEAMKMKAEKLGCARMMENAKS